MQVTRNGEIEIKNILNKKKSKLILLLNNNFDVDYDEKLTIEDIDRLKQNLDICNFIINNYTMYIGAEYNIQSINNINHLYESIINNDINNDFNVDFNKINENNSFLLNEESIINNYYIYKEQLNKKELLEYKLKVINDLIDLNEINEHCNMCMKRKPLLDDYNKQKIELIKSIDNININNKDDYDKLIIIKKQQEILINKYNNYKKRICKNIIDFNNNKFIVENNWLDTIKEYREYLLKNIRKIHKILDERRIFEIVVV